MWVGSRGLMGFALLRLARSTPAGSSLCTPWRSGKRPWRTCRPEKKRTGSITFLSNCRASATTFRGGSVLFGAMFAHFAFFEGDQSPMPGLWQFFWDRFCLGLCKHCPGALACVCVCPAWMDLMVWLWIRISLNPQLLLVSLFNNSRSELGRPKPCFTNRLRAHEQ